MQAKKQYKDEFKKEAIRLLETSEKTVTEIDTSVLAVIRTPSTVVVMVMVGATVWTPSKKAC